MIPCQYDEVGDFSEGLAAVKDAIQIDFYPYEATEGRRVLAGEYHDGMAIVLYYGYEGRDDLLRGLTLFY